MEITQRLTPRTEAFGIAFLNHILSWISDTPPSKSAMAYPKLYAPPSNNGLRDRPDPSFYLLQSGFWQQTVSKKFQK